MDPFPSTLDESRLINFLPIKYFCRSSVDSFTSRGARSIFFIAFDRIKPSNARVRFRFLRNQTTPKIIRIAPAEADAIIHHLDDADPLGNEGGIVVLVAPDAEVVELPGWVSDARVVENLMVVVPDSVGVVEWFGFRLVPGSEPGGGEMVDGGAVTQTSPSLEGT